MLGAMVLLPALACLLLKPVGMPLNAGSPDACLPHGASLERRRSSRPESFRSQPERVAQ